MRGLTTKWHTPSAQRITRAGGGGAALSCTDPAHLLLVRLLAWVIGQGRASWGHSSQSTLRCVRGGGDGDEAALRVMVALPVHARERLSSLMVAASAAGMAQEAWASMVLMREVEGKAMVSHAEVVASMAVVMEARPCGRR